MKANGFIGIARLALASVFAIGCSVSVWAQSTMEGRITLTLDNWDGRYEVGQTVAIHAEVEEGFEAIREVWVNGLLESKEKVFVEAGKYDIFTRHHDEPAAVMLKFCNTNPKKTKDFTDIGYCVGWEQFRPGFQKPADFMEWWQEQVAMLRQLPIEAIVTEVAVPEKYAKDYVCYDVEINCGEGGAPVRGYMAMPKGAVKSSLPICIYTHGSGVKNKNNRSLIDVALSYACKGGGAIAFDINAHGMKNDQPQEYYDNLDKTTLKDYRLRPVENREDYYQRGIILRLQRLVDWMCTLPEWDGERVLVVGGSQGGAQVAAICGLDNRVTHGVLKVPAWMDRGGCLLGRRNGPPHLCDIHGVTDEFLKWCPYFDVAFFLEYNTAELVFDCGLVDSTCTATSVLAGYNVAAGKKTLYTYPYRHHSTPKGKYKKEWQKRVNKPINDFMDNALK